MSSGFLPVTATDELSELVVNAHALAFVELARTISTTCDYCPRPAFRKIEAGNGDGTRSSHFVCRAHARHAAICIVGTL